MDSRIREEVPYRGFIVRHHEGSSGNEIVCIHAAEIGNDHNALLLKTIEALVGSEDYDPMVRMVLAM